MSILRDGERLPIDAAAVRNRFAQDRVLRADGGLSGYRWGVDRKRQLLDREQRA